MNIGVIGLGFVGKAVAHYLYQCPGFTIFTFDKDGSKSNVKTIRELVANTQTIFLCVPTPMKVDGHCDTSIVESVVDRIQTEAAFYDYQVEVVLKSTVPPGTTDTLQRPNVQVIFNPEFLTEKNAHKDFAEQDRIYLGGVRNYESSRVLSLYRTAFPDASIYLCTPKEAELLKYVANTFLALKVIYANQIAQLAEVIGVNYRAFTGIVETDPRLGKTHWRVPGHDGDFGFGGTCFPKDTNALLTLAADNGVNLSLLEEAWEVNLKLRQNRDWEQLKGRAVVE